MVFLEVCVCGGSVCVSLRACVYPRCVYMRRELGVEHLICHTTCYNQVNYKPALGSPPSLWQPACLVQKG